MLAISETERRARERRQEDADRMERRARDFITAELRCLSPDQRRRVLRAVAATFDAP